MRYRLVKFDKYYAVEVSFFGLFKRYADLASEGFWWERKSCYFPACLTPDRARAEHILQWRGVKREVVR